ncbi:MAG: VRR-NUC domain-containing protein [Flavobacterium sp.]
MAKQEKKTAHIVESAKEFSAAQLTKWAKGVAESYGMRINRVNNIPVRRRKGTIEKGWSDLQGYTARGVYVAIEVKKIGDRLSKEQIERLNDVIECGGVAYICTQQGLKPILNQWTKMEF